MIFFYQYFLSVQVLVWPGPGYTLEIQGVAKKKFTTKDVNFTGFRVDLGQNVKKQSLSKIPSINGYIF